MQDKTLLNTLIMKRKDLEAEIKAMTILEEYKSAIEDGENPDPAIAQILIADLYNKRIADWKNFDENKDIK